MRTVFATAVALVLAQGCTVLEVREISRAALESPAQGTIDDEGYVRLPGVRVAATARNDRVSTVMIGPAYFPIFPLPAGILSPAEAAPYFWIDVTIDPEGEAFTFDPREVRLHIEPGSSLVPSLTKGPTMVLPPYSRRHSQELCGFDPTGDTTTVAPIPLRELSCFSLRFEVARPGADAKFAVTVGGLANDGRPVVVPTIHFARGHAWSLDALP